MAKTKTFEITKDFGDKTLEKVFVKDSEQVVSVQLSLSEGIKTALSKSKSVCVVAESALSDQLLLLLASARKSSGVRIYIITKNIQPATFEMLKNNCIVREVSGICGNYLICDCETAFFFDSQLQGYAVCEEATVSRLHDMFVYEFWNNATKEFVSEAKPVAERTFDVAPVLGNESLVIDRSAQENHPYEELLHEAEAFAVQSNVTDFLKNSVGKDAVLYLDKRACESSKDWILKTDGRKIVCTESSVLPLCKSGGNWYILNSKFNKDSDNTGKLFSVRMEDNPVFAGTHTLKDTFTYREAVGRTMFAAKDFSAVSISATDTEERIVSYDYKQFKKIVKMAESEREAFFDKIHILLSDKFSASITFNVTMTVKQLSKGAVIAPIYAEYEKFIKQRDNALESIENDISSNKSNIKKYESELQKIADDIALFNGKVSENEKNVQKKSELEESIKSLATQLEEKRGAKKELSTQEKDLKKLRAQQKETTDEIAKLQKKKKDISTAQKKLNDISNQIRDVEAVSKKLNQKASGIDADEKNLSELQHQQKEIDKKIAEFKKYTNDGKNLEQRKSKTEVDLSAANKRLGELESLQKSVLSLTKEPKTVAECKDISTVMSKFHIAIPAFDKPKYGVLYNVKSAYEYELLSDDDTDVAEEEMNTAGITDVEFVSASH
ncbi:MAG: hypothetical protein IJ727_06475 [Treponema sp.]|nr:hypothetical protein [Treponema sp.]